MEQKREKFLAKTIKKAVGVISDGAILDFFVYMDKKINQFFPELSDSEQKKLKIKIMVISLALISIYGIDRRFEENRISYGRNLSKQDKEETIFFISKQFSVNPDLLQKRINKKIKQLNQLGKKEKNPNNLEKRIERLLDEEVF